VCVSMVNQEILDAKENQLKMLHATPILVHHGAHGLNTQAVHTHVVQMDDNDHLVSVKLASWVCWVAEDFLQGSESVTMIFAQASLTGPNGLTAA